MVTLLFLSILHNGKGLHPIARMVSSSKFESLAHRYAPYIDELRDFFRSRRVLFGSPADLSAFPAHLADPAFHEEMVSMVRSILYRESETIPRSELMELVAIAVGGPQIEEASAELADAMRQILTFVTEVSRSQRSTMPPEFAVEDGPEQQAGESIAAPVNPLHLVFPQETESASPDQVPLTRSDLGGNQSPVSLPINDRLSRALIGSEAVTSSVRPAPVPDAKPRFATTGQTQPASPRQPRPRSVSTYLRGAYWIPGLCVLLLAIAAAWYLQSGSTSRVSPVAVSAPPAANPTVPKPSPYGSTYAGARHTSAGPEVAANRDVPATAAAENRSPGWAGTPDRSRPGARVPFNETVRGSDHTVAVASPKVTPRMLGGREGVFLASSGMMAAHLLTAPAPSYPKLASIAHVEGEVIVQVVVARDGRVEATRVLEGPRLLRSAAEHAIRRWRYRPYLIDGKPTDVATIVTVNFRLTH